MKHYCEACGEDNPKELDQHSLLGVLRVTLCTGCLNDFSHDAIEFDASWQFDMLEKAKVGHHMTAPEYATKVREARIAAWKDVTSWLEEQRRGLGD